MCKRSFCLIYTIAQGSNVSGVAPAAAAHVVDPFGAGPFAKVEKSLPRDLNGLQRVRESSLPREGMAVVGRAKCRRLRCEDRKSTRLNSSHSQISYAVFCLKKKKK